MPTRTPAETSAQILREIPVLRHGDAPAAAARHARDLQQTGEWCFESHDLLEPLDPKHPLSESPAELSKELADWLLARTAEQRQAELPETGLDVSDTDWAEFERWGGSEKR